MIPVRLKTWPSNEKTLRNGEIFALWYHGMQQKEIGHRFNISGSRVGVIIQQEIRFCHMKGTIMFDCDVEVE
jgi:Mor family transcriptional regulator